MRSVMACGVLGTILLVLGACGGSKPAADGSSAATSTTAGAAATVSPFDGGPRAGDTPVNEALVATGEALFKDKGCSACHTFGKRMSGPDLDGVTHRRTAQWMENQILHPEKMVKEDPISHQLFGVYALQMPNQGLTQDQARAVIEFLKHKNHEAGEAGTEKEKGK